MIQSVMLVNRLGCQADAQLFKCLDIHLRQHDGGVDLAVFQLWKPPRAI